MLVSATALAAIKATFAIEECRHRPCVTNLTLMYGKQQAEYVCVSDHLGGYKREELLIYEIVQVFHPLPQLLAQNAVLHAPRCYSES